MVGADVPGGPPPARGAAGASNNRAARGRGVSAGARDARPYQCRGPLYTRANVGARPDATRRGRRGYFARRAVVRPTWGPLYTRANVGARADVPRRGRRGYIAR